MSKREFILFLASVFVVQIGIIPIALDTIKTMTAPEVGIFWWVVAEILIFSSVVGIIKGNLPLR